MKIRILLLMLFFTELFSVSIYAVPAYPFPIKYKQPDGSEITIQLKGDERVHWGETTDGYTLLSNGNNGWEYAITDANGELKTSGVIAREVGKRTVKELTFLKGVSKNIRFSLKQTNTLKQVWEAKYGSDKLIGSDEFFKKTIDKTSVNDGRRKVFTPSGTKKLIMILIEYTDVKFTKTRQNFVDLMNTQDYNLNGAQGSVQQYFYEMSYGQFNVETDVAPYIYTANNTMAYYGAPNGSAHDIRANDLMKEAIEKADPDVDYTQYDNDNDGSIDGVYIIYAGYGEATGGGVNTIWPHAGGVTGTFDGKTASKYSCSNELNYNGASNPGTLTTIGVICHEFGHVCGAPDYYDTDYATGGSFTGNGYWDLMDTGLYNTTISNSGSKPAHFNPFEKVRAGWLTPITINATTSVTIPDISTNAVVYKYNTTTPDEYFLMENRQKTGFNAGCPGHGLMIYHYSKAYWDISRNKTAPQGFYPVCASAATSPNTTSDQYSYGNINSSGCPFPGSTNKTSFTNETTPSAKSWAGQNFYKPITNITENNLTKTVSFDFMGGSSCTPPSIQATNLTFSNIQDNQMTVNWTRGNGDRVIVLARSNNAVNTNLLNGTVFNANSAFQRGDLVDPDTYVIYDGDGTNVTITDLQKNLTYYFAVFEYTAATHCYTTTALTGSASTTGVSACVPSCTKNIGLGISNVSFNTINNSSSTSTGYTNYSQIFTQVTPGQSYNLSMTIYGGANPMYSKAWIDWNNDNLLQVSEEYDLSSTTGTSVGPLAIVVPSNAYLGYITMRVRTRFNTGPTACDNNNYSEAEDYTLKVVDVCVPPTTQASNFTATNIQSSQMTVNWTRGNGDKVLVIAHQGAAVNFDPISGRSYNANAIFKAGDEIGFGNYIVYNGTGSSVNVTGLEGGTTYYYSVYEYISSTNCYIPTSLTGNATTTCISTALPYADNFNRNVFGCWTTVDNTENGSWQIGTTKAGGYIPSLTGNYFYINCYSNSNSVNTDLISPTFDFTNYSSNIILSFNHQFVKGSATASVYYSIDNGANWAATPLATFTSTTSNPSNYVSVPLIALQGQSQVKFKWTYTSNATNYYWAIDDVQLSGNLPIVVTVPITGLTSTAAVSGGNVTSIGASAVTAKGVCWSTIPNPTVNDNKTTDGTGTGAYRSNITGLTANTLYYVRAYATNDTGTSYGSQAVLVAPPTATTATLGTSTGFTAIWDASSESTNYSLDVSSIPFGNTALFEKFDGFTTLASNADLSSSLDSYLQNSGWSGTAVYTNSSGYLYLNNSTSGQITTATIDLSGNSGNYTAYLDVKQVDATATTMRVMHAADGINFTQVFYVPVSSAWVTQKVQISGGTSASKIKFATAGTASTRIYLDNIRVEVSDMLTGYTNLAVSGTSKAVTVPTAGTYYYRVRANGTNSSSISSNVVTYSFKSCVVTGGNWSSSATWSPSGVPTSTDNVLIASPNTVTIDVSPAVCNDLSIESGATLNIGSTKALTVNGAFTNNAGASGFVLQSDATGTATFVNSGTVNTEIKGTVQQYLATTRNWYISSPVSNATLPSGYSSYLYREPGDNTEYIDPATLYWKTVATGEALTVGLGYIALPTSAGSTLSFTTGSTGHLNDGEISIPLTKTIGATKSGFNLIGNPYPSYLNVMAAINANNSLEKSIWYRTRSLETTPKFYFETVNTTSGVGTNNASTGTVTGYLPPMQAFWVKANAMTNLILNNSYRSHATNVVTEVGTVPTTPLKSPSAINSSYQSLRLKITNGLFSDESIIYFNPSAQNGFDAYDSRKMSNESVNIPEIYTIVDGNKLVINGMNTVESIPLGFTTGEENTYSIRVAETSNFEDQKIYLVDNQLDVEAELTAGKAYTFTSSPVTTDSRFTIVFRTNSTVTDLNSANALSQINVYSDLNKRIIINLAGNIERESLVRIYDQLGRILYNDTLIGNRLVIDKNLNKGVYLVEIVSDNISTTKKLIVN